MSELCFNDFKKLSGVRFAHCEKLFAENPYLRRIKTDSRQIQRNDVFWVLIGEHFDAHQFVPAVSLSGALCAVVQKEVETEHPFPQIIVPNTLSALQQFAQLNRQKFKGTLIALTGSNGKTTTKEMIAHLLQKQWHVHKTQGNFNNHIGCPLTLLQLDNSFDFAVVELGTNHPGEMSLLSKITRADAALITNIGPAHLEFFKTLDGVATEKLALFEQMKEGKVIFVNGDDPYLINFHRDDLHRVTFGLSKEWDVYGQIKQADALGNFTFVLNDGVEVHLQVPGKHNVLNAIAASAVALHFGLSEKEIAERLETFTPFEKRMQMEQRNGIRIINDAYNANPQSMKMAFQTLVQMEHNNGLILVLGDMFELGEQAFALHKEVLTEAVQLQPEAILVMGPMMCKAAQALKLEPIHCFETHQQLAQALKKHLRADSLLFIKGSRGMEMEKILEFI